MLRLWLPQRHLLSCFSFKDSYLSRQFARTNSLNFLHTIHASAFSARRSRDVAGNYESSISSFQKKSKGQKKREALRSVDWAAEFADFSDSQVRRAIRWGNLREEVYEAVKVVKKIGKYGRHARTRQLKLIGGMLREADPALMEAIIKAIKDGDVEGVFSRPPSSRDQEEDSGDDDGQDDDDDDDGDGQEEDDYDYDDDNDGDDADEDDDEASYEALDDHDDNISSNDGFRNMV
ncbi:hypothetical protein KP509_29G024600 [Ceratopteris richardii]|uniref:Uncharacterized protein n=1 Tax=Ceratopteris richardii TaxID=49495 RepID=A0A8T2R734_CERRI|nr:hypothetical protein KP509_29G024600 [Ceratopteris richardii]